MTDQAHSLRKNAWETQRNATYLSVSSGKGGVGKTNFVVNLAYSLAELGKKVLVFDADLGLANVDILLSVSINASIRKYLEGGCQLEDMLKKDVYGFDLLPASSGFAELTRLTEADYEKIVDVFIELDSQYDFIIFDTGAGISDSVVRFSALADHVIVVTMPEPTAITDAYAFMKVVRLEHDVSEIQFVLNRVDDVPAVQSIFASMQTVARKFLKTELTLLGYLREDKALRKAVRAQKPLIAENPKSPYAVDVANVARKLAGLPDDKNSRAENLYQKLKGVFK